MHNQFDTDPSIVALLALFFEELLCTPSVNQIAYYLTTWSDPHRVNSFHHFHFGRNLMADYFMYHVTMFLLSSFRVAG